MTVEAQAGRDDVCVDTLGQFHAMEIVSVFPFFVVSIECGTLGLAGVMM